MDTKKTATYGISLLCLLILVFSIVLVSGRKRSSVRLSAFGSKSSSRLVSLNSAAKKGYIKNTGSAFFMFTEDQREQMVNVYNDDKTVSVTVRIELVPNEAQQQLLYSSAPAVELPFYYGFLFDSDFNKNNKIITEIKDKVCVSADLAKLNQTGFDISIALESNDFKKTNLPKGFFIYSTVQCSLKEVCVTPALIGFDVSSEVPFYGFAPNGGIISPDNSTIDFTGAAMVFPVKNTIEGTMPQIKVSLLDKEEYKSSVQDSVRTKINFGGERFYIKNVKCAKDIVIPSSGIKQPFSIVDISDNKECLTSFLMCSTKENEKARKEQSATEVFTPIVCDPGLVLYYPLKNWRVPTYEIFEWDRYNGILFFDIVNYSIQDNFFRRIAYYIEKEGYKGTLLTNEQLEGKHGYNAHDYSAESLASFFNKADSEGFVLNYEEEILRKILVENKLLIKGDSGYTPGQGGIVSISRESQEWLRASLLAHEGWHTIFFRDESFRNFVSAVTYTMDPQSHDFMIDYFKSQPSLGYDTSDEYLLHNEFMAYLMQQPLSEVAKYFVHCAERGSVMDYTPDLARYVRQTKGQGFEDAAIILNDYCFDNYGVVCGNIALVQR